MKRIGNPGCMQINILNGHAITSSQAIKSLNLKHQIRFFFCFGTNYM